MKRRNFIILSALTAATVSVPFLNCSAPDPVLDKKLSAPQTLFLILDEQTIKGIGEAYGKLNPGDYSVNTLEKKLSKDSDGKTVSSNSADKDILAFLGKTIHHDFETGNTVIVNGWVLSATEARQCALFSLIKSSK